MLATHPAPVNRIAVTLAVLITSIALMAAPGVGVAAAAQVAGRYAADPHG
jgi:hypothetical protein